MNSPYCCPADYRQWALQSLVIQMAGRHYSSAVMDEITISHEELLPEDSIDRMKSTID